MPLRAGTTVDHVDLSEDNETNDAELRITYTQTSPSNTPPTATIDSITPNPATTGQSVTFTGHGVDTDGTVTAYEWTSSISGALSTATTFSTSSLSAGTHTISLRVQDDDGAWSTPVTSSVTVTSPSNTPPTAFIDSITPNPATTGQSVTFTGHGVDTDGTIAAYEWTSSISGALSTTTTFSTSSLSAGTHTISLRVKDDDGAWSTPVTSSVTVTSPSNTSPTAFIDSITPNPATTGQSLPSPDTVLIPMAPLPPMNGHRASMEPYPPPPPSPHLPSLQGPTPYRCASRMTMVRGQLRSPGV